MPNSIEQAIKGTPVSVVCQVVEPEKVEAYIAYEIIKLASRINVDQRLNIQDHQVEFIASQLMVKFRNESLADFSVCFKRGAMGKYGDIFRLDGAILCSWMDRYMEEKYRIIEDNLIKEKDEYYKTIIPVNSDRDWLGEWQEAVKQSEGVRMVTKLTPEEIEREGQAKPARDGYRFNESEAQVKLRESRAKIFECQELAVRERHDDWTEEQIQAHLKHLQDYMIQEETKPKFSPEVERIMNSKRKKSA